MITATERFSVSPKEDGAGLFAKSSYDVLAIQKFGPESGTYFLIADENKNLVGLVQQKCRLIASKLLWWRCYRNG